MVFYKLTLNDNRETKGGTYPVVIRITYQRNNTTIAPTDNPTGYRADKLPH